MSHADDGTLHAYLDGELSPVERERLDRHLADCAACRARRDEERALIERADRLLALAAPPERAAPPPPLSELRRPRPLWVVRYPLAWAATIVLAFGVGWYLHGLPAPDAEPAVALVPRAPAITAGAARATAERRDRSAESVVSNGSAGALASAATSRDSLSGAGVQAPAPSVVAPQNRAALRGGSPAPVPPARVTVRAADQSQLFVARQAPASTTWPVIAPGPARDLLGGAPAQIPGLPVLGIRRNPADAGEIVVEQSVDSTTVVEVFQRRLEPVMLERAQTATVPSAAPQASVPRGNAAAVARPARIIGSLRVEIAGPLSADSLLRLLQLVR